MKYKIFIVLCLACNIAIGQINVQTNLFASGFIAPVSITHCGDGRLFVLEKSGRIMIIDSLGNKLNTPFLDIDSIVFSGNDERGLLGLAFDPDYNNNGYFYVFFIDTSSNTQLCRYSVSTIDPNQADATSKVVVFSINHPPGFIIHKGGHIAFGADGYLYCAIGDEGGTGDPLNNSQNTQNMLGKMIRIDVSTLPYTVPASNPFVGSSTLDEIWALGLRNPWRWSFDRISNDLWISDVGQGSWEEINFQPASSPGGENYGWRCYEANAVYNALGCDTITAYDFPVYAYPHVGPNSGCAVMGGYVYRGTKYNSLFGIYLFVDYCAGKIWGLDSNFNFIDYGGSGFGTASMGEDANGELYLVNVSNGNIYSISTNECHPVAYIKNPDSLSLCTGSVTLEALQGPGLSYQWLRNFYPIPGANAPEYTLNIGSNYRLVVTDTSGCTDTSEVKVVIQNRPLAAITGGNSICDGLYPTLSTPADTGWSYQWKHKNIDIPGATQPDHVATLPGNYRVLVTTSQGCTRLANPFNVTIPPPGAIVVNGSNTICIGDSVEITAKAIGSNYTYQWIRNNVQIPGATNQNYFATANGFYRVTVTNQNGCAVTGSGKLINETICPIDLSNSEWRYFNIYTVEGKLLHEGRIPDTEMNYFEYFNNNFNLQHGVYFINLYDGMYMNRKTLKLVF